MSRRSLYMLFMFVCMLAVIITVRYFFFTEPQKAPTLGGTKDPLNDSPLPSRFGFITQYFTGEIPESTSTTEITNPEEQILTKIWDKPTAGGIFVSVPILKEVVSTSTLKGTTTEVTTIKSVRASSTVLMFVDRTTGYIYGHSLESGRTYQITNTTIPGIYDAYIWKNGRGILMRYLDTDRETIISTMGDIPVVPEDGNALPLEGVTLLPKNIASVAVSSSGNQISYVVPNSIGSSFYTITTKGVSTAATSPFSEWNIFYGGEQLYATTKPSAYVEGYTVSLPSFLRLVGNKTGLTSISSQNGILLNSMWAQSGLLTFLFSKTGSFKNLSVKTLSSKCAQNVESVFICAVPKSIPRTNEGLPDDWYQGSVSYDDTLSLVDGNNGETYSLYSFDDSLGPMDILNISSSSDGKSIGFMRKQDGSLWLLKTDLIAHE